MAPVLKNRRGQTSIEYLLLLAAAFVTTYLVITGPIATFTTTMITQIKSVTQTIMYSGEVNGSRSNPYDRSRMKPIHL